jgi:hypothetical protein
MATKISGENCPMPNLRPLPRESDNARCWMCSPYLRVRVRVPLQVKSGELRLARYWIATCSSTARASNVCWHWHHRQTLRHLTFNHTRCFIKNDTDRRVKEATHACMCNYDQQNSPPKTNSSGEYYVDINLMEIYYKAFAKH